jgi:lipid II:glycine glycyltransferase (peptidoglycan interpeptide bridge formation enzyme)
MKACVSKEELILFKKENVRAEYCDIEQQHLAYKLKGNFLCQGVFTDLSSNEELQSEKILQLFLSQIKSKYDYCVIRTGQELEGYASKKKMLYHRVPLDRSEEFVWKKLHSNTRRCIRQAKKKNVKAGRAATTENNIQAFFDIRSKLLESKNLPSLSYSYYRKLFSICAKTQLYLAWHEKKCVSGLVARIFNNRVHYSYPANVYREKALSAHYLLVWELIRENIGKYDYFEVGIAQGSGREGIERFKKRWGGENITLYDYTYVFSPVRFQINSRLRQSVRWILRK